MSYKGFTLLNLGTNYTSTPGCVTRLPKKFQDPVTLNDDSIPSTKLTPNGSTIS